MIVSFCCVGMRIDMFFSLKISWIHLRQYLKDPAWGIVCLKNKRIGVQQFPHEHLKISRGYKVFSNLSSKRYLFWLGQQGGLVFSYVFFFSRVFWKIARISWFLEAKEENLAERLQWSTNALLNAQQNGTPFRHLLLHGPPGTGELDPTVRA